MALTMVSSGISAEEVADPEREVNFPASVIQLFKGELGQPYGGFPPALQRKVLKGETPMTERPGAVLPPADLEAERREAEKKARRSINDDELASYLMYPQVFLEYATHRRSFSNVAVLPTPAFFFGPEFDHEFDIELERGKTLLVTCRAVGEADSEGHRTVFFELNGQPRTVRVPDRSLAGAGAARRKADDADPGHVGAPMPGLIVGVTARSGQKVERGDPLFTIEAMKMESAVYAEFPGTIEEVVAGAGHRVEAHDLVVVISHEE